MAIVESMMSGVVPVRTPAGGHADQIPHEGLGFVVPFGDVTALADRIHQVTSDAELRAEMSRAAREHARQHFSLSTMTSATEAVYEQVIAEPQPRRRRRAPTVR
jgi:glycosyltransferase involved in cell wall biosynthesis